MLPEEVARYDEHWLDVAEKISNEALDNQIDFIKNGGITKPGGGAYKPAKISAAVDLNTGDIYFGYNGANKFNPSIQEIHPDLQQRINRTMSLAGNSIDNEYASRMSFEKWSVDNCAEIYSVNNALQNQATLDNIFINTKYFKDGKYALPCRNCQVTFEGCLFPNRNVNIMEKVTEERLVKAGWDEKRTIDISNIKDVYQKLGLVMPMNVEKFLTVYGMLVFEDDERKENLEFIPEKALGCNLDKVYFEELLEEYDINEIVYPIGVACRGNLMVLMTEQDVFYCYTDGYLEKAGENVEQMLDCLVGECNEAVVIS